MPEVTLHPVTAADGPDVIAANRASQSLHAPWVSPCTDGAGFSVWLKTLESPANAGFLVRDAPGRFAGIVNFSQIFLGNSRLFAHWWRVAGP